MRCLRRGDGVLVNSELIAQKIELDLLASIGMSYTRDEYVRRFTGTSVPAYRAELFDDARERFAVDLSVEFLDRIDATIDSAYEGRLAALPGVRALASAWRNPKAVASSSSLTSIMNKLRTTGLADIFGENIELLLSNGADVVFDAHEDLALHLGLSL